MFSSKPMSLPPTIRQKFAHLLSLAARLHLNRGVPIGPPEYIQECYPKNCFTIDRSVITPKRQPPGYGKFVGLHSLSFEDGSNDAVAEPPIFNAFQYDIRQEEKELEQYLYGPTSHGHIKSINSFSSFDPTKYASRPSFSSTRSLRDLTAHLRHPSIRGSGVWNDSLRRNSDRNVYLSVASLICRFLRLLFPVHSHRFSLERGLLIRLQ